MVPQAMPEPSAPAPQDDIVRAIAITSVLGDRVVSPVEQSLLLWDQLIDPSRGDWDEQGRLRLDRWELDLRVQDDVAARWRAVSPETITDLADIDWFRAQVRGLYGFDVLGIDYEQPVEPDLPWPQSR